MRIRRPWDHESDTIPLAPLIDIVFLTLVFFMVTSVYGTLEAELDIQLPAAETAESNERVQGEIFINLRADGGIVVNDRALSIDELEDVLERVATYFPGGSVIVRGDRNAALGQGLAILDVCRKAGIENVAFATTGTDDAYVSE